MRITADIIDEESFFISREIPDNYERNAHIRNLSALSNNQSRFTVNRATGSIFGIMRDQLQNSTQHTQTVQEVTQKFQDLNLYDIPPSSFHQVSSSRARCGTMQLFVNNLPVGCKHDELKALFSQYGTVKQVDLFNTFACVEMSTLEEIENAAKALNKYQLRGSTLSVEVCSINNSSVESPPLWFQYHMSKMKQEIKKELLEELLNISSDTRHAHADVPSNKTSLVVKEDNHIQCQGEVVHNDIYCDNCDQLIHGIRYKCGNCSDFDLCQECESLPNVHNKNHIFLKIRYPFALKMFQKQKWQELMSPLPIKSTRFSDSPYSKVQKKKLYEATFICDETVPDGTIIPPSTPFVKSWKVMNSGARVWTHTTKLHLIQGSRDLIPSSDQVDVPHLKPGEEGIVSILFTSPAVPGVYRSHWNFCHKSRPFGAIVWCHINVKPIQEELRSDPSVSSDNNELSEKIVNKQMEASNIAQVLTAVKEEHEEDNMVPRKLIVNSHTATPNNTPFALTPPKSPDHETFTKSEIAMAPDRAFFSQLNDSDNEDDECSVVSLNSTDSDTEFVVIPMPKCFNLSESFISEHFRMPQSLIEAEVFKNSDIESTKDPQVKNTPEKPQLNSETVSQETGVPELSENICKLTVVEDLVNNKQTTTITQVATDGSSSEISIIDSGSSSPSLEKANETIDSINIKLSTENTVTEIDQITARLTDVATSIAESATNEVNQEQVSDIPNSATFPKFPIEGVTGELYERLPLNPNNLEEKTIQVLPEGLVFGALNAAASVYNTAKAVISTIQHPKEYIEGISQPLERPTSIQLNPVLANNSETLNPMDQLIEMGFCNRQQNEILLKKHNGDVATVVGELVNLNDNDWYNSRHVPPSPPGFLD